MSVTLATSAASRSRTAGGYRIGGEVFAIGMILHELFDSKRPLIQIRAGKPSYVMGRKL